VQILSSTHFSVTYLPIGNGNGTILNVRSLMITYNDKTYECPMEMTMDLIGGKWKVLILWHLSNGVLRFNEINHIFPKVSPKMLAQQLKDLEKHGFICKKIYPQIPPKVEYVLTDLGHSLIPILQEMNKWGTAHINTQTS